MVDRDPKALEDHDGRGRPGAWTQDLRELLQASFPRRPDDFGYVGMNGTVPLLREPLHREGGRRLSDDTIRRELDRLGYVGKRFR